MVEGVVDLDVMGRGEGKVTVNFERRRFGKHGSKFVEVCPLLLGVEPKDLVLLSLTFLVGSITLASGRTHLMQGAVHLVIFAAFLLLALVP